MYQNGQVYMLTPNRAQELCNQGYVFIWKGHEKKSNNHQHNKGEPELREYEYIGKW